VLPCWQRVRSVLPYWQWVRSVLPCWSRVFARVRARRVKGARVLAARQVRVVLPPKSAAAPDETLRR
jgi:hypothetical protein